MNSDAIQAIESNIKESRRLVEMGQALQRLRSNRDFRAVILDGFFQQEAIRLVHLKADPNMQSPERQRAVLLQMDAIGALNQYFDLVLHKAAMAAKAIEADEEARDEILMEEAGNV